MRHASANYQDSFDQDNQDSNKADNAQDNTDVGSELHANALLLQGPVGPFFSRIAEDLDTRGFGVFKINFNGGDRLFYPRKQAFDYTGKLDEWDTYIERFMINKKITRIYLFGDCRSYHRIAKDVAQRLGIRVFVFEEGYIRPNFITLEEDGVNGHSSMMGARLNLDQPQESVREAESIRFGFFLSAAYSMLYYWASAWRSQTFKNYQHHRPFEWFSEGSIWIRSAYRKLRYRRSDESTYNELISQFDGEYYLCPLQVHCDMQVLVHSKFNSIEHFIGDVLTSFANDAAANKAIVFKHHPLDRGYTDYTMLIANLVGELGLQGRVFYVHDVCLPSLLKNAAGCVMINSTVGMSSLFHGTPVKVLGDAIYDKPGLTSQQDLSEFWLNPGKVDEQAFSCFRSFLVANNQLNGNLYLRLSNSGSTGLIWSRKLEDEHSPESDQDTAKAEVPKLRLVGGKDVSAAERTTTDEPGDRSKAA